MPPEDVAPLELRDYLRVLRRRKWTIAITVLVCMGAALVMALVETPIYSSSADVLLERRLIDTLLNPLDQQEGGSETADRQRGNEIQVMGSPKVRASVEEKIGRVPEKVTFTPLEGTDVVSLSVSSESAKRAAETANAYATRYIKVRRELAVEELNEAITELQNQIIGIDAQLATLEGSLAALPPAQPIPGQRGTSDERVTQQAQLQARRTSYLAEIDTLTTGAAIARQGGATVLVRAKPNPDAINNNPLRNMLAGLAIGLVLGVALAFLREYLDDTIKNKDDLESASGLAVVGLIPELPDWKNREAPQLVSTAQPRSPAAEAYRTVRTSIEFLGLDQPIGSLQLTSAMPGEGKTTTLANLAITFARGGQRVIVLCCDLRRPRIHEFFGLDNRIGFTSMLLGNAPISQAIQTVPGDLPIGLVASGPLPPNPAELLASKRAVAAIEALDSRCDLLLIDSPPVLPVTDALVIAGLVDGVLLVGNSGSTTKRGVRRAAELLHQVRAPLIGAVLNGVHSRSSDYGYVYGDSRYYGAGPESENEKVLTTKNGGRQSREKARTRR